MLQSRHIVLALLFGIGLPSSSFLEAAKICETPILGGLTIHTFVRMKYSCSAVGASCSQKLPFTNWANIGFEKAGWSPIGAGQLRDDGASSCNSWTTGYIGKVADLASASQERKAVADLADAWKNAGYGVHAGTLLENTNLGCNPKSNGYSPRGGSNNVCWTFTCAYVSYLYQKLNVRPAAIDSEFSVRSLEDVPSTWTCKPEQYGSGDGCQCACGTFDPDCDPMAAVPVDCPNRDDICIPGSMDQPICSPRQTVLSARKALSIIKIKPVSIFDPTFKFTNDTADVNEGGPWGNYSSVFTRKDVPSTWTCNPLFYGSKDGCDCSCGAWDPDCDVTPGSTPSQRPTVFNCHADDPNVQCTMSQTTPSLPVCLYDRMAAAAAVAAGFPSPSESASTSFIVAASVGSTLGVVALLAVVTYLYRRHKKRARAAESMRLSLLPPNL